LKVGCVTFNEQLMSLIQANPLLHKLSVMSTRMVKQRITLCEHHNFYKLMIFCCLTKANSRLLLFLPLLIFLLWDCVWH